MIDIDSQQLNQHTAGCILLYQQQQNIADGINHISTKQHELWRWYVLLSNRDQLLINRKAFLYGIAQQAQEKISILIEKFESGEIGDEALNEAKILQQVVVQAKNELS